MSNGVHCCLEMCHCTARCSAYARQLNQGDVSVWPYSECPAVTQAVSDRTGCEPGETVNMPLTCGVNDQIQQQRLTQSVHSCFTRLLTETIPFGGTGGPRGWSRWWPKWVGSMVSFNSSGEVVSGSRSPLWSCVKQAEVLNWYVPHSAAGPYAEAFNA